jgi:hypothetical protein
MARRSRVEINRAKLDEVMGGLADGVFDVARAIGVVAENRAPDATPYGEGLVDRLGAIVWVRGQKVHEWSSSGRRPDKPRALRVKSAGEVVGVVGAGFPGMFQELGTVHHSAQPFLTPSAQEIVGSEARLLLSKAMERRLRGERSANTAKIRERIAASRAAKSEGGT